MSSSNHSIGGEEELNNKGMSVLYVLGLGYLSAAFFLLNQHFFIPTLTIIIDRGKISRDVGGAVIVATATSIAGLVTALIGAFIAFSDFSMGSLVGDFVFNLSLLVGLSCLLSPVPILLTPVCLARDITAITVIVVVLALFSLDSSLSWLECSLLIIVYFLYLASIKVIRWSMRVCCKGVKTGDQPCKENSVNSCHNEEFPDEGNPSSPENDHHSSKLPANDLGHLSEECPDMGHEQKDLEESNGQMEVEERQTTEPGDDVTKPLSLTLPSQNRTCIQVFLHFLLLPAKVVFMVTIPDPHRPGWHKFYPLTLLMCLIWQCVFSYLSVSLTTWTGQLLGLHPSLAWIFMIPLHLDLISTIILTRNGDADLAVHAAFGRIVFRMTFNLGLPWLLTCLMFGTHIQVDTKGLVFSVVLMLFLVLMYVLTFSLARCWVKKTMSAVFLLSFFIVGALVALIQHDIIIIPL